MTREEVGVVAGIRNYILFFISSSPKHRTWHIVGVQIFE